LDFFYENFGVAVTSQLLKKRTEFLFNIEKLNASWDCVHYDLRIKSDVSRDAFKKRILKRPKNISASSFTEIRPTLEKYFAERYRIRSVENSPSSQDSGSLMAVEKRCHFHPALENLNGKKQTRT